MEFNYPMMGGPMDCCIQDSIKKTYFDKSAQAKGVTLACAETYARSTPSLFPSVRRAVQRQLLLAVPLLLLRQVLRRRGGRRAARLVHQLLLRLPLPLLLHLVRPSRLSAARQLKLCSCVTTSSQGLGFRV